MMQEGEVKIGLVCAGQCPYVLQNPQRGTKNCIYDAWHLGPHSFERKDKDQKPEKIDHPLHYGGDVPHEAIKCITANQLNFVLGNAVKYIFRAGKKGSANDELDDLRKARWYLDWEIRSREQKTGDK
jgi:hypothetical protein